MGPVPARPLPVMKPAQRLAGATARLRRPGPARWDLASNLGSAEEPSSIDRAEAASGGNGRRRGIRFLISSLRYEWHRRIARRDSRSLKIPGLTCRPKRLAKIEAPGL